MSSVASRSPRVVPARGAHTALVRLAFIALLAALALAPPLSSSDFQFPGVSDSWVLLVAAALTAIPVLDLRRPRRLLHLDLLMLLVPAIALAFEQRARAWPIVLVYIALAYLCTRLLLISRGRSHGERAGRLQFEAGPLSARWLVAGIAILAALHLGWAASSSVRNDSAEGAVQGATRLLESRSIYGASATTRSSPHGDVYGPVLYEAYAPLAAALDDRDAARVASGAFDLLTALLLFLLASRLGGRALGLLAAYCWLAFPLTFYEDALGFNDGLVAASLLAVLLAAGAPAKRGLATAIAVCGKLSPLVLLPVLTAYRGSEQSRGTRRFLAALIVTSAVLFLPVMLDSTPALFISRTLGFQIGREPADSLWSTLLFHYESAHTWLVPASRVVHGLVLAGAVTLAIFARRLVRENDAIGLAAVCAAVMIALQASLSYWSYSYILWFAPLAILVLLAQRSDLPAEAF